MVSLCFRVPWVQSLGLHFALSCVPGTKHSRKGCTGAGATMATNVSVIREIPSSESVYEYTVYTLNEWLKVRYKILKDKRIVKKLLHWTKNSEVKVKGEFSEMTVKMVYLVCHTACGCRDGEQIARTDASGSGSSEAVRTENASAKIRIPGLEQDHVLLVVEIGNGGIFVVYV
ncbi:hypothetical protein B0H12DRAFT_1069719 [Mycena haematopus]|nr:hypothetical protein B0H12DRAFT_1069719 [Mycena haematopus]